MKEVIVKVPSFSADYPKAPIYVAELVRCKECKHWKWIEWAKESRCTLRNTAFNARADDFCSYGERKE